jgi:outer membrane protein
MQKSIANSYKKETKMKKLITSALAACALTSGANAGMVIDVQAGAGMWAPELNGFMKYGNAVANRNFEFDQLGIDDASESYERNNYVYIDVDHFLPLIPNIRVERLKYAISGNSTISSNISFGNLAFGVNESATTDLEMVQNDLILYWGIPGLNLLSAGILDVDFGIMGKQLDGYYQMTNNTTGATPEKIEFDQWIPMAYLAVQVDVPVLPLELEVSTKRISYEASEISDNMAKVSLALPIPIPLIDTKLDVGYREQILKIDPSLIDNFEADVKTKGLFFGLSAKF